MFCELIKKKKLKCNYPNLKWPLGGQTSHHSNVNKGNLCALRDSLLPWPSITAVSQSRPGGLQVLMTSWFYSKAEPIIRHWLFLYDAGKYLSASNGGSKHLAESSDSQLHNKGVTRTEVLRQHESLFCTERALFSEGMRRNGRKTLHKQRAVTCISFNRWQQSKLIPQIDQLITISKLTING